MADQERAHRLRLPPEGYRPFHHGNLRAALLTEAERTLREQGIEALSLRDLARQAGVSHGAPRRHFTDRNALLDALAELGFLRLSEQIRTAITDAGENYGARLQAAATAYVSFATSDAALLDLMFAAKNTDPPAPLRDASEHFLTTVGDLIAQGQQTGNLQPGDPQRLQLLLVATLQGIATLVTSRKLPIGLAHALITDAVALFTRPRSS